MNTLEWTILAVLTLANLWLSWRISLRMKRFHGIFRLVTFECIILMVLLNYPRWFRDPLAWQQLVSWVLLLASLLVAVFGLCQFYSRGRPSDGMEETTRLIDTGLYRYIRHPMYLSLILGGFGVMMKDPRWLQVFLSGLNFLSAYLTARLEEGEMKLRFGEAYAAYMKRTKMFVPFIL